jgi:hypothetical protein
MRKVKRSNTKKNKLRKRVTNSKSIKYIGGGESMDNEYSLVGYTSMPGGSGWAPIFLHNNKQYEDHEIFYALNSNLGVFSILFLPNLYKLKNVRNILAFNGLQCIWVDDNMLDIRVTHKNYTKHLFFGPLGNLSMGTATFESLKPHLSPKQVNNIKEIELKYPGLFKRMVITAEEEQQALEDIQQKEEAIQQEKINERQKELDEIKKSILQELRPIMAETQFKSIHLNRDNEEEVNRTVEYYKSLAKKQLTNDKKETK